MSKQFASVGDMEEKKITFEEIGKDLWAFTAEGDPNTGVIIGDDSVMIIEAQATPALANKVIEKVRSVTDKPISHLVSDPLSCCSGSGSGGLSGAEHHHEPEGAVHGRGAWRGRPGIGIHALPAPVHGL
jgi:hypothetical protein